MKRSLIVSLAIVALCAALVACEFSAEQVDDGAKVIEVAVTLYPIVRDALVTPTPFKLLDQITLTNSMASSVCSVGFYPQGEVDHPLAVARWNPGGFPPGSVAKVTGVPTGFYDIYAFDCADELIGSSKSASVFAGWSITFQP